MKLPVVRGLIDRRILANYRIDPVVMNAVLPRPFRPKIVNGFAIGGICLIRLKSIRPRFFPFPWGVGSENAAHRIAVEWDVDGEKREGVFVPRRDTSSLLKRGSVGYSVTHIDGKYDGLELRCREWKMETLIVEKIDSSYFDDNSRFPAGSIQFDCALLMRSIEHEWHGHEELCCSTKSP